MNKNNKLEKNMFKKIGFITLGTFLFVNSVFTGEAFASIATQIMVNDLEITIDRSMGGNFETYEVTANDSLKDLSFEFSNGNKLTIEGVGGSWTISTNYNGTPYSTNASALTAVDLNGDGITDLTSEIRNAEHMIFTITKSVSDAFFNRMLVNHDPFTFSATSQNGKDITVVRTSEGGDAYTFSSTQTFSSASVVDGDDNIDIKRNGNTFTVSGQYNGRSATKTFTISFPFELTMSYGGLEVGLIGDEHNIKITPDPSIVSQIAQRILEEKQKITEIIIEAGVTPVIPSGSEIRDIEIPASVTSPQVQFTVEASGSNQVTQINNELTVVSQNANGMQVVFPQNTQITGPDDWNGTIKLPTVLNVPTVSPIPPEGYTNTVESVIKIGLDGQNLSFNNPVTLIFPGMAGKEAGFVKNSVFSLIQNCNPDGSFKANECKKNSGNDLVVLTNHFTEFVVYRQTVTNPGTGGGPVQNYLTISSVNVNTQTSVATITFNVSSSASAILRYGTTQGSYSQQVSETVAKTSHSFTLTSLSNGTYYYKIEADDNSGSIAEKTGSFTIGSQQQGNITPGSVMPQNDLETSTKIKEQKTYNYNGIITTKPITEMNKSELYRLFLLLLLKSLLLQRGITL